jgi:endonuclease/exonuclease/phosphatase family metal-dependent hydrolase
MDDRNESLSVLTYHLSDEDYYLEDRYDYILDVIERYDPTIICLQEIVDFKISDLEIGLEEMDYYTCNSILEQRPVGEMIASKYPISKSEFFGLEPRVDMEGVLVAKIDLPFGSTATICTFNLPKGPDEVRSIRGHQLRDIIRLFRGERRIILAGDFGLTNREFVRIPSTFKDAFVISGESDSHTYTYDGTKNPGVNPTARHRYDRILYKLPPREEWKMEKFGLLGLNSIFQRDKSEDPVMASDHFGVYMQIARCYPEKTEVYTRHQQKSNNNKNDLTDYVHDQFDRNKIT